MGNNDDKVEKEDRFLLYPCDLPSKLATKAWCREFNGQNSRKRIPEDIQNIISAYSEFNNMFDEQIFKNNNQTILRIPVKTNIIA